MLGLEYEPLGIAASTATHFEFHPTALPIVRPIIPVWF